MTNPPITAAERVLIGARDNAIHCCRNLRLPQETCEKEERKAKAAYEEAQQKYKDATDKVAAKLAEIRELETAYKRLFDKPMPRPDSDIY